MPPGLRQPDDLILDGLERVGDAQAFLKIGRTAVYELMNSGALPYVKIGRSRRIPRRALLELATRNLILGQAERG